MMECCKETNLYNEDYIENLFLKNFKSERWQSAIIYSILKSKDRFMNILTTATTPDKAENIKSKKKLSKKEKQKKSKKEIKIITIYLNPEDVKSITRSKTSINVYDLKGDKEMETKDLFKTDSDFHFEKQLNEMSLTQDIINSLQNMTFTTKHLEKSLKEITNIKEDSDKTINRLSNINELSHPNQLSQTNQSNNDIQLSTQLVTDDKQRDTTQLSNVDKSRDPTKLSETNQTKDTIQLSTNNQLSNIDQTSDTNQLSIIDFRKVSLQLLYKKHITKDYKEYPGLQSILEYVINNKTIVRNRKTQRRSAICEDSQLDRDIIRLILKQYKLEKTLSGYSL